MSIIRALQEYLMGFDGMELRTIHTDGTESEAGTCAIAPAGNSKTVEDIIGKHMWPLTAPLPYYKESYMVSLADKICATLEMAHLYGLLGVRRNLRACRPALLRRAVQ